MSYNGYNEIGRKATVKYMKDKLKQLNIRFKKNEYEQLIKPLCERAGMKPTTYIKIALKEKLQKDFPGEISNNAITSAEADD